MNKETELENAYINFIKSNDKGVLVTGTNKYEKHKILLKMLDNKCCNKRFLFITSTMIKFKNKDILGCSNKVKAGDTIIWGHNYMTLASYGTISAAYGKYDGIILYPVGEFIESPRFEENIEKINKWDAKKIFYISCSDFIRYNDYSALNSYIQLQLVYDDPDEDYHNEVINYNKTVF